MNVSTALPVARRHAGHAAVRGLHSISNILTRTFHHPHQPLGNFPLSNNMQRRDKHYNITNFNNYN